MLNTSIFSFTRTKEIEGTVDHIKKLTFSMVHL